MLSATLQFHISPLGPCQQKNATWNAALAAQSGPDRQNKSSSLCKLMSACVFFLFFAVKGLSFSPWGGYFYENQQHVLAINAQLFNHSKWLIAIKIVPSHFFQSANPWSSTADGSSKDNFIPQNKIKSEKSAAGFVTFWERFICSSGNVNTHLKIKWTSEQER